MIDINVLTSYLTHIIPGVQVPEYLVCCQNANELLNSLSHSVNLNTLQSYQLNNLVKMGHKIFEISGQGLNMSLGIERHVNLTEMKRICGMKFEDFYEYGTAYDCGYKEQYIYKDNGGKILAIGHLDSVVDEHFFYRLDNKVYCPQLDDRLGVYVILDIIAKKYNIDILLTDNEESGRSTAQYFNSVKQYNWMFEIDRTDDDAALYQYDTPELREKLRVVGIKVGHGSFTDISMLDHLGCAGINFPAAYYNYHSVNAYCTLDLLNEHITKILTFIDLFKDEHIPHTQRQYNRSKYNYYDYETYSAAVYNYKDQSWQDLPYQVIKCPECGEDCFYDDTFCFECGTKLESLTSDPATCAYCNDSKCRGMQTCKSCEFTYHNSEYITCFGCCRDCLSGIFNISDIAFEEFESDDVTTSNKAFLEIYAEVDNAI